MKNDSNAEIIAAADEVYTVAYLAVGDADAAQEIACRAVAEAYGGKAGDGGSLTRRCMDAAYALCRSAAGATAYSPRGECMECLSRLPFESRWALLLRHRPGRAEGAAALRAEKR